MASTIFWLVILCVYVMLARSYQMAALSRCRDEARAVIRTYADQFERLQTTTKVASGASYTRWLFLPDGETGRGLAWGSLSDANVFDTPWAPAPNLAITLGAGARPVAATISRNVIYVNAATGADSPTQVIQASGYMLKGVFTVKFSINNKSYSESLTVLRAVP